MKGAARSLAGIVEFLLCARGAGKGMTPTCGSGRAVRGGDAGRVERGREGEWETGLRWPLRPWAERVRVLGRASREIGPGKKQVHLRGLELRSGRAGVAGPQGWGKGMEGPAGKGFWVGFGFLVWGLGWVSFLLLLLFLFLFKLTQPNLFEFKIEFEFNSNTQTNKSMLQHECNIKSKPRKNFNYLRNKILD